MCVTGEVVAGQMAVPWGGEERARAVMSLHAVNFCYRSDLISAAAPVTVQLMWCKDRRRLRTRRSNSSPTCARQNTSCVIFDVINNILSNHCTDRNMSSQHVQFQLLSFFKFPSLVWTRDEVRLQSGEVQISRILCENSECKPLWTQTLLKFNNPHSVRFNQLAVSVGCSLKVLITWFSSN